MEPIILASKSPRRQKILKKLNIPFMVVVPDFKEEKPENIRLEKAPEYFAAEKVKSVVNILSTNQDLGWVFSADTAIFLNNKLYGKPKNADEARRFLNDFSGKTHKVLSGIALYNGKNHYLETKTVKSLVSFKALSTKEIDWYIKTEEWHGAAGGYRVQGLAQCFIYKIEGSYSSIMGLPISDFYDILTSQGYAFID
ncbi:MAG TPA: Maf family protein [Treponemataceae bacterium]|nr:Maf family protein [Treponemataceae bacterium]